MLLIKTLRENEPIHRIFGKVEIETIIKRINGIKLKQTERNYLSRSIRPKLIGASILSNQELLAKIQRPKKRINKPQVIFSLEIYGYALISPYKISKQIILPIEELTAKILIQFPEPRFIEGIPIILIKNKINPYELLETASKYDIKNQIGYLLETSFLIAKKYGLLKKMQYLYSILNYFKSKKDKDIRILGQAEEEEHIKFLKKTSPKRIKEWNLLGRYFDDDFIKNAGIYLK